MAGKDLLQPTDEEAIRLAKTIIRTARHGTIATLDPAGGAPIATRVSVSSDFDGAPLLLISRLAAHYPALAADPRCSLLLGEPRKGDPMAHARITIAARARIVDRDAPEHARLAARHLSHQPKARLYAGLGDFNFVRLEPLSASLNGGFGRAYAFTPQQLLSNPDGDLAAAEAGALEHMNDDHAEAVSNYARHFCKAETGPWTLTGIDADGMNIAWGDDVRRIFFETPLAAPQDMHQTLVQMARTARLALSA